MIKRFKEELAVLEKDMERLEAESNESELRKREEKRILDNKKFIPDTHWKVLSGFIGCGLVLLII